MRTKMTRLFLLSLLTLLSFNGFSAIDSTNAISGNWNDPTMWKDGTAPTAVDDVVIMPGTTIALTANDSCKSLNMRGGAISSTVSLNGFTLVVTGTVTTNVPTAADTNLLDVGDGYLICSNFSMAIGTGVANSLHKLQIGSGTVEVQLNYSPGNGNDKDKRDIVIGAGGSLILSGNVSFGRSTYFFDPTSTVVYNSPNNQVMLGGTETNNAAYPNLTISGGLKTLSTSLSVNGIFTLDGAIVRLNASTFTMNNGSTLVAGKPFGNDNMIETNSTASFIRLSNTVDGFKMTYPVGINGVYSPLVIDDLSATLAGGSQIKIRVVNQKHALLSDVDYINRFWLITTPAMTNINIGSAYFVYDDVDITNNELNIDTAAVFQLGAWNKTMQGVTLNTSLNRIELAATGNIDLAGQWTAANGSKFENPEAGTKFTILDGSWANASTWNNNTLPANTDNVLILHDVSRLGIYTVNNLTVAASGRLQTGDNNDLRRITVNGTTDIYGVYFDDRNGGVDTYVGKVTIHPTGNWSTTAVSTAANQVFVGGIENNGVFNIATANFSTSQSLSGANLLSISGGVTIPADVTISNKGMVRIGGVLTGANASTSIWLNDTNSVLEYGVTTAPMAIGVFDVDQLNNTVVYYLDDVQTIPNFNYYNLTIETRGSSSRTKSLSTGDYLILGNLTVNSTNTGILTLKFNTANTQSVVVNGNVVLTNSKTIIEVPTATGNATGHSMTVHGGVICDGQLNLHANANNTFYADMTMTSSGLIMSGTGTCRFRNLTLTGSGLKESTVSDLQLWWDGSTPKTATFSNIDGDFVQTAGNFTIKSWGGLNNITNIGLPGNGIIKLNNLMVGGANDHVFTTILGNDVQVNGNIIFNTDNNAKFDLNGNALILNGDYKQATETCKMKGNSMSSLIINGTGNPSSSLIFDQTTPGTSNELGTMQINRPTGEVALGNSLRIDKMLYLTNGSLKNGSSLMMDTNSVIVRKDGSLTAAVSTVTGAQYSVEYTSTADVTTGNELLTTANTIKDITVETGVNTLTFNKMPIINGSLVYKNGKIAAEGVNYVQLATDASIKIANTTDSILFPVGTTTKMIPVIAKVNSTDGDLLIKIKNEVHPNKTVDLVNYLPYYLNVSGSASAFDYNLYINYNDVDVIGDEAKLFAYAYIGAAWYKGADVDGVNNIVGDQNIIAYGDFTALGEGSVSVKNIENKANISIYPIPVNDNATVAVSGSETGKVVITVYNLLGNVVMSINDTKNTNDYTKTINMSSLSTGKYIVKIAQGNNVKVSSFVKK